MSGNLSSDGYYPTLDLYLKMYDETERKYAFRAETVPQLEAWQRELRGRLREIAGVDRCIPCDPRPRFAGTDEVGGFQTERHLIETEPGVVMPYDLIWPEKRENLPVLILPHGHGGGRRENLLSMTGFVRDCLDLGFLVACPDERGAGERREFPEQGEETEKKGSNSHRELLQVSIGFGRSVIGSAVWDLQRLADHLLSLPETGGYLACAGMSGGGQQALWFAALDDRVSAALISGYFYGMKEALIEMPQNCSCNYVPYLYETADMGDIGALIAPRFMMVESGEKDPLNGKSGLANVYPQLETARGAYRLLGAEDRIRHSVHPGGHQFVGRGMKEFLRAAMRE